MTSPQERLGKNEAVFREVNERIREVTHPPADAEFLCECGDPGCMQPVPMTLAEYEEIRGHPKHFLVLPGHEIRGVETIVDRRARYTIVQKEQGAPAKIAVATDPRG